MSDELLRQLSEPFPLNQHRDRKLPGGGQYVYVPWDNYMQRLNDLCGMDWSAIYTDPVVSGDYLSIRCKLTIAGSTREGIGSIHTFPEKNESGKEKIIGDPPNNALRSAFTDACYMFGMGRYLDGKTAQEYWLRKLKQPKQNNADRVKECREKSRVGQNVVRELLADNFEGKHPNDLSADECDRLIAMIEAHRQLKAI